MPRPFRPVARILIPLAMTAALSASGASAATGDCLQQAAVQFAIQNAQCSPLPQSGARNACLGDAVQDYSAQVARCNSASETASAMRSSPPADVIIPVHSSGAAAAIRAAGLGELLEIRD